MWTSSEDDYWTYLERVAEAMTGTPPLPLEEYELLLEQLDDLHVLGIERELSEEESAKLDELSVLLLVDHLLDASLLEEDVLEEPFPQLDPLADETGADAPVPRETQSRSRVARRRQPGEESHGARIPRARARRQAWRRERRRQRGE